MSKLAEFRKLERTLAEQMKALESMKMDDGLKKEIEFEKKLRDLLVRYNYGLKDIINLLEAYPGRRAPSTDSKPKSRRARAVKVYKNPHNDEIVETKGGNHRRLKEWKTQYGAATVESWLAK